MPIFQEFTVKNEKNLTTQLWFIEMKALRKEKWVFEVCSCSDGFPLPYNQSKTGESHERNLEISLTQSISRDDGKSSKCNLYHFCTWILILRHQFSLCCWAARLTKTSHQGRKSHLYIFAIIHKKILRGKERSKEEYYLKIGLREFVIHF